MSWGLLCCYGVIWGLFGGGVSEGYFGVVRMVICRIILG